MSFKLTAGEAADKMADAAKILELVSGYADISGKEAKRVKLLAAQARISAQRLNREDRLQRIALRRK